MTSHQPEPRRDEKLREKYVFKMIKKECINVYGVSSLWLYFIGSRRTLITKYPPVYSFIYYINYAWQCKLNFVYLEGPISGIPFRLYEIVLKEPLYFVTWMNHEWRHCYFLSVCLGFVSFLYSIENIFVTSICPYIWWTKVIDVIQYQRILFRLFPGNMNLLTQFENFL